MPKVHLSGFQAQICKVRLGVLKFKFRVLNVRFRVLKFRFRVLKVRFRVLKLRFRVLNAGSASYQTPVLSMIVSKSREIEYNIVLRDLPT